MSASLLSSILSLLNSALNNGTDISIHSLLGTLSVDTLEAIYKEQPRIVFYSLIGVLSDDRFNSIRSIIELLLHSFIETNGQEQLLYASIGNLLREREKGNILDVDTEMCIEALVKASCKFKSLNTILKSDGFIRRLRALFVMYDAISYYNSFIIHYARHNMKFVTKGFINSSIDFDDDILSELYYDVYISMFSHHPFKSIPRRIIDHVLGNPVVLKDVIQVCPAMKDIAVTHAHKKNEYTSLLWSMDIQSIRERFVFLELSYEGTIIEDILNMSYEGYVPALSVLSAFVKDGNLALLYAIKDSFVQGEDAKGFDPIRLNDLINDVL